MSWVCSDLVSKDVQLDWDVMAEHASASNRINVNIPLSSSGQSLLETESHIAARYSGCFVLSVISCMCNLNISHSATFYQNQPLIHAPEPQFRREVMYSEILMVLRPDFKVQNIRYSQHNIFDWIAFYFIYSTVCCFLSYYIPSFYPLFLLMERLFYK